MLVLTMREFVVKPCININVGYDISAKITSFRK